MKSAGFFLRTRLVLACACIVVPFSTALHADPKPKDKQLIKTEKLQHLGLDAISLTPEEALVVRKLMREHTQKVSEVKKLKSAAMAAGKDVKEFEARKEELDRQFKAQIDEALHLSTNPGRKELQLEAKAKKAEADMAGALDPAKKEQRPAISVSEKGNIQYTKEPSDLMEKRQKQFEDYYKSVTAGLTLDEQKGKIVRDVVFEVWSRKNTLKLDAFAASTNKEAATKAKQAKSTIKTDGVADLALVLTPQQLQLVQDRIAAKTIKRSSQAKAEARREIKLAEKAAKGLTLTPEKEAAIRKISREIAKKESADIRSGGNEAEARAKGKVELKAQVRTVLNDEEYAQYLKEAK